MQAQVQVCTLLLHYATNQNAPSPLHKSATTHHLQHFHSVVPSWRHEPSQLKMASLHSKIQQSPTKFINQSIYIFNDCPYAIGTY